MPLAVMLRSVDSHLDPDLRLDVHVADDGLDAPSRARVERSLSARVRLRWWPARWEALGALPTWGRMPLTTYLKLSLAEWLPSDVGRAVWLDCDLVMRASLARLWREELGASPLGAIVDRRVPRLGSRFGVAGHRELGLDGELPYFNAGVMVCDLAAWRASEVARRALGYIQRYGNRIVFQDQEALNAVFAGRWRSLDPRWNWDPTLDAVLGRLRPAAAAELHEPWIVHFAGRLKPWRYGAVTEHHQRYFEELDATAWAGWRPRISPLRALAVRYARSPFRRWLYPLEPWSVAIARALSRRTENRA